MSFFKAIGLRYGTWSISTLLLVLATVQSLPFLAVVAFDVDRIRRTERETLFSIMSDMAEEIAGGVDRKLASYVERLKTLATSPALSNAPNLSRDQLIAAYAQVRAAVEPQGLVVFMQTPDGRQVFNTRVSLGERLLARSAALPRTMFDKPEDKPQHVSGTVRRPGSEEPIIEISVPIVKDGRALSALSLSIERAEFELLLVGLRREYEKKLGKNEGLGWLVSHQVGIRLIDAGRAVIATDRNDGSHLNQAHLKSAKLRHGDWSAEVRVQRVVLSTRLKEALWGHALLVGSIAALGILGAWFVGRMISKPIVEAARGAVALGAGNAVGFTRSLVREVNAVGLALKNAAAQRQVAIANVRDNEARLRAIFDSAAATIVVIDEDGNIQNTNASAEPMFGYAPVELEGKSVALLAAEADAAARPRLIELLRSPGNHEIIGRRKDGTTFPIDLSVADWSTDTKRFFTGIMRDITDHKRAEQQMHGRRRELVHRLGNLLRVVHDIVLQIARNNLAPEERKKFEASITPRLNALSYAHDLLLERSDAPALREVLEIQLAAFPSREDQLSLNGPDLVLDRRLAFDLGLAVHELATNATKYGSLKFDADGRVDVAWAITQGPSGSPQVQLSWTETGGPKVVPPTPDQKGFGQVTLTEHMQAYGKVTFEFRPQGVVWQLDVPLGRWIRVEEPHKQAAQISNAVATSRPTRL